MSPQQLQAWLQQNRVAVLGVAGAGAVALGLRARKARSSDGETPPLATDSSALATGANIAGTVPYDSSSTDAYNALMPAIQQLYDRLDEADAKPPLPVPAAPAVKAGFYRNAATGGIYQVDAKGSRDYLTMKEYLAFGKPKTQAVAANSSFWADTKLIGGEPKGR